MLLHKPDKTFNRLVSCYKRAKTFSEEGEIDTKHPLATAWSNCKMMLDARADYSEELCEDLTYDIVLLDWFAERVDIFAKSNVLAGDKTVAAILWEWLERMFFNPCLISIKQR